MAILSPDQSTKASSFDIRSTCAYFSHAFSGTIGSFGPLNSSLAFQAICALLPDKKLGWLMLNATGGHPGEGRTNAVVRRWTAPLDCTVSITGSLEHTAEAGDGVRGSIISSRQGALGFWPVFRVKREMNIPKLELKKGDTVDFVVDSFGTLDSDSFNWAPSIKVISGSSAQMAWNAKDEFSGPKEPIVPLNAWEKYAHVLLMSNELAFVD